MFFLKNNSRGETIIEIIIVLIIIVLTLTSSFKIISLSFRHTKITKDRIIAINLAREGMEAVRYIRDYNWLFYGSKQRICWNHLEDWNNDGILNGDEDGDDSFNEEEDQCTESDTVSGVAAHQIGVGDLSKDNKVMEYVLKQDNSQWFLTREGAGDYEIGNGDWEKLTKENMATREGDLDAMGERSSDNVAEKDIVESFRLCKDKRSEEFYVSCLNDNTSKGVVDKNYREANPDLITKFFRYVKIIYDNNPIDSNDIDSNGLTNGQEVNTMTVVVGVKWMENESLQDVELVTKLTDFYKRTNSDGKN